MNHYDDLQRFQEKTRTQNLKFQDLSSQAATREHGDWAILNQLNPDAGKPASLALGGSVSAPLPQPVPADLFQRVDPVVAAPASPPVAPVPPVIAAIPLPVAEPAMPEPVAPAPAMTSEPLAATPVPEPVMAPPRGWPRGLRRAPTTMPTCSRQKPRSRWRKIKTSL